MKSGRRVLWIAIITILVSVAAFVGLCIWKGAAWVFANVIPNLEMLDVGVAMASVLLIPFGFFHRTRRLSIYGFLVASLVFATTVWLFLFAIGYGYDPFYQAVGSVIALIMGSLLFASASELRGLPIFLATVALMQVTLLGAGAVKLIVDDKAWGTAEILGAGVALAIVAGVLSASIARHSTPAIAAPEGSQRD